MRLLEKQFLFTRNLSRLIRFAYRITDEYDGFIPDNVKTVQLTMGRAYASAAANKADKGIDGSCHTMRLAIDLNLFVNGEYITGDVTKEYLFELEQERSDHAKALRNTLLKGVDDLNSIGNDEQDVGVDDTSMSDSGTAVGM